MDLEGYKIEKVASGEIVRYALTFVHVNRPKSQLEASNGKTLAVVPIKLEDDETGGYISVEAIKEARRAKGHLKGHLLARENQEIPATGQTFPRPDRNDITFPDINAVLPKKPSGKPDVILSAKLLYELAQAISQDGKGDQGIGLWFNKDKKGNHGGIYVKASNGGKAYGVIMPRTDPISA